jgi:nucleotide-binding universal stress UspA family protein
VNGTTDGRPIVVGIDGSDSARRAAMWAAAEAARRRVPLKLVTAVSTAAFTYVDGFVPPSDFFESLESEARGLLSATRSDVRQKYPNLDVQLDLRAGHPVTTLIEESDKAGLVVLGSRDLDGVHRLLAGSTAVGVAGHSRCPVAVVRARVPGGAVPCSGPVVVGVDGAPASESAVSVAFEEASARGVELVAVHAWIEFASDTEYRYARQYVTDWRPIETREYELLAERLAGWQEKYPDVSVQRVVSREKPAEALLTYAAHGQLLVVGTQGHGGFVGVLLGSTSQKLIHHAPCPVVLARPYAEN